MSELRELRARLVELERHNAELRQNQVSLEATQASEAWFRSLFTNVHTAIAATDRSGRLTHFNEAFLALLGHDAEAMRRMNFSDFTAPGDLEAERVLFEEMRAGTRKHYRLTQRYFGRGGRVLWVDLSVDVICDAKDEVTHFVAVIDDVTQLCQARTELERAHAELQSRVAQHCSEVHEKETLLREVHHRVKNNLQVVASLLSLQAAQSTEAGVRAALAESAARVQVMALVHERLHRSARLRSLELGEHLSSLAKMVFQSTHHPGITLDCEVESMEVDLESAMPLGLILNELVSNACKHAFHERGEGRVSVRLRRLGAGLELVVEDDGQGLPPGVDLEKSPSLGLRIVCALVRQLRATLSVEPARGTRIRIIQHHPLEKRSES